MENIGVSTSATADLAETIGATLVDSQLSRGLNSISEVAIGSSTFGIRHADTEAGRAAAGALIRKMYSWRGYDGAHNVADNSNITTITAENAGEIIGTVTLTVDSEIGLLSDASFCDILDGFRARGAKIGEITKLAIDNAGTKESLASLFHILYIHAKRVNGCSDIFIEINPRHRRYYERMLGFQCLSDVRNNPRVNAPAFLLWINTTEMAKLIEEGTTYGAEGGRSLYPHFFSKREEDGIAARIVSMKRSPTV